MIVMSVARKPPEKTIIANVVKFGSGGLNVEGSRIGMEQIRIKGGGGDAREVGGCKIGLPTGSIDEERTGRFPANLVLVHLAGCVMTGTERIKGEGHWISAGDSKGVVWGKGFHRNFSEPGSPVIDAEGFESVPVWVCAKGCPVSELDRNVGIRTSGSVDCIRKGGQAVCYGKQDIRPVKLEGNSGNMSRFFKQVKK